MHEDTEGAQTAPRFEAAPELELPVRVRNSVSWWRRPLARVIDLALLAAPAVWVFSTLPGPPSPGIPDDLGAGLWILAWIGTFLWVVVAWPIYEASAVAVSGRTIGKWITGLCVVDEDAGRVRVGSLLGRTILLVGSFVGALVTGWCFWFAYPPLAAVPIAALGLSEVIPALRGERTWLDLASGSDVVRRGRLTGAP